jgi:hypothetical protein
MDLSKNGLNSPLGKILDLFVKTSKKVEEQNILKVYDSYDEAKQNKYKTFLVNFLFFVATKQTDPLYKDYISRLALCLAVFFMTTKSLSETQSGGIGVFRNGVYFDLAASELQPGDILAAPVVAGGQLGNQVSCIGNSMVNNQVCSQRPPENMQITQAERGAQHELALTERRREAEMLQADLLISQLKKQQQLMDSVYNSELSLVESKTKAERTLLEERTRMIKGDIPLSAQARDLVLGITSGTCCMIFVNTAQKVTINAGDNCLTVAYVAIEELGKTCGSAGNVADYVTPNVAKELGKVVWNWGAAGDKFFAEQIKYFNPSMPNATDAGNIGNLMNGTVDSISIGPNDIYFPEEQLTCFEYMWEKARENGQFLTERMQHTDAQCGLACCFSVWAIASYCTWRTTTRSAAAIVQGAAVNKHLSDQDQQTMKNLSKVAVLAGGGLALASGVGAPFALSAMSTANTIINNPLENVENQNYPQLQPVPIQPGPQPILIGAPPQQQLIENVDPTAVVGMRQRNPNQNAGYQKFKKTKRNNKKTRKTKRNNRKSRKYKNKK